MNIKLHSKYNHFPNHVAKDGQKYIDCYCSTDIMCKPQPNSVALLIEPRCIEPQVYDYIEEHYKDYLYIFTHDSKLLDTLPNAKLILWGMGEWGVYGKNIVGNKTKLCSMVSSYKEMCALHKIRKQLAFELEKDIDCYGTYNGGEWVDTNTAHAEYKFSIIIENYIDDYWFTEKICNCFLSKTIPIYWGARKIDEFFDARGIIQVNSAEEIREAVRRIKLPENINLYNEMLPYVEINYEKAKKYCNFENWFFNEYEDLLNSLK